MPVDPQPDASGWTHIVKTRGRRHKALPAAHSIAPNPASPDATLAQIAADFARRARVWESSTCRAALRRLLDRGRADAGWEIATAVCLAVGSFSRDNLANRKRSMWQFVVFMDVVQHVRAQRTAGAAAAADPPTVKLYAQEPVFTDLDREFLRGLGFEVLDVPAVQAGASPGFGPARAMLGPHTFLFEPFMETSPAMAVDVAAADVGLYVGSSLERWNTGAEPGGGRDALRAEQRLLLQSFFARYQRYWFPRFEEDPTVLEGMAVYYRVGEDGAGDE